MSGWRASHMSRRGGYCRLLGFEGGFAMVDMADGAQHRISEAAFTAGMVNLDRFRGYAAELAEEEARAEERAAANEALRAERRKRKAGARRQRKGG